MDLFMLRGGKGGGNIWRTGREFWAFLGLVMLRPVATRTEFLLLDGERGEAVVLESRRTKGLGTAERDMIAV